MTQTELLPEVYGSVLGVHHHTRTEDADYLRALDEALPLQALCGVWRAPHQNPVSLPCCPGCAALLKRPCVRGEA